MASGEDPASNNLVFHEDEDLLEDVDVEEDDEGQSDSTSDHHRHVSSSQVTVAIPSSGGAGTDLLITPVKKSATDESRKLFQRLWTDEDEIELLRGFLEYTANRCGPHDTTAFYDQIKTKFQLDFNKNQLVEKLRRLKKKYRNLLKKFGSGKDYTFKTPHDQATFEIAAKIWGNLTPNYPTSNSVPVNAGHGSDDDVNINFDPNFGYFQSPNLNFNGVDANSSKASRPRKRNLNGTVKFEEKPQPQLMQTVPSYNNNINYHSDNINADQQIPLGMAASNVVEETVRSCLTPVLKELLGGTTGLNLNGVCCGHGLGGFGSGVVIPFGFLGGDKVTNDERWKKQQILELEVLSKRLELVQDQIKEQLNNLRSTMN